MVSFNPSPPLITSRLLLNKYKPFAEPGMESASAWFSKRFPRQAEIYGCPFIELQEELVERQKITPLAMNQDFFAAVLGGDERLGHQVVYYESEMQFFFLDSDGFFKPTTDEKLGTLLRALLMKCAEDLPESVQKLNLCIEFRSDKKIREIVNRGKSILAADHTFFGVDSEHQRTQGSELHQRVARVFIQQLLEKRPGEILTLSTAYLLFSEFLKRKQMDPVKRQVFKPMFAPLIREQFDLGLRNDIVGQNQRQTAGWKNLRAVDFAVIQN
jgi:hypothetical protein